MLILDPRTFFLIYCSHILLKYHTTQAELRMKNLPENQPASSQGVSIPEPEDENEAHLELQTERRPSYLLERELELAELQENQVNVSYSQQIPLSSNKKDNYDDGAGGVNWFGIVIFVVCWGSCFGFCYLIKFIAQFLQLDKLLNANIRITSGKRVNHIKRINLDLDLDLDRPKLKKNSNTMAAP